MKMEFRHTSVLLDETIENLNIRPDGIYLDGTLGGAGHSLEIVKRLSGRGHLYGIDQDGDAIEAAKERLGAYEERVTVIRDNYVNARAVLEANGVSKVDGILLDLGVSSYQFDNGDRGFSYRTDAPLDMRMDTRQELTAEKIVNEYSEADIFHIIRDYGEEQFAQNIAKHIVEYRKTEPIRTTGQLNGIIKASIPARIREKGGHPSKQTFQALRIACNHELDVLG
jgi:16S rRNA (cytosine1402-N4)-methyltransferase